MLSVEQCPEYVLNQNGVIKQVISGILVVGYRKGLLLVQSLGFYYLVFHI